MAQNASADLDILATGYVDILRKGVGKVERGELFQNLFLQVISKSFPSSVSAIQRARLGDSTARWQVILFRGRPLREAPMAPRVSVSDVVGVFEVRAYGAFSAKGFKGERAVEVTLSRKRDNFLTARKSCPNLRLSCYFSLQEITPKRRGNNYYGLTKKMLEPEVVTVIPFHSIFSADRPIPPMYPSGQVEWNRLVDRLGHL